MFVMRCRVVTLLPSLLCLHLIWRNTGSFHNTRLDHVVRKWDSCRETHTNTHTHGSKWWDHPGQDGPPVFDQQHWEHTWNLAWRWRHTHTHTHKHVHGYNAVTQRQSWSPLFPVICSPSFKLCATVFYSTTNSTTLRLCATTAAAYLLIRCHLYPLLTSQSPTRLFFFTLTSFLHAHPRRQLHCRHALFLWFWSSSANLYPGSSSESKWKL